MKLWRITASRLRTMTPRELARLQTFPDDWVFEGGSNRLAQLQVGNAVPVLFARRLAENLRAAVEAAETGANFADLDRGDGQLLLA